MELLDQEDIVGRHTERAALDELPTLLREGAAAVVLHGAAGMGKTTLWAYSMRALSQTTLVLSARPGGLQADPAYAGLADLVRGLPADPGAVDVERDLLRRALGLTTSHGGPVDPADVAIAFTSALRGAARARPVVLAVDDLQWLDPSSSRVLNYALRRLRTDPVGVVASRRTSGALDPLAGSLLPDRLRIVDLSPLTPAETDTLIRRRLGAALPRSVLDDLHRTSGGNPMFALELARALLLHPHPLSAGRPLPVPHDLLELVDRRLASLTPTTREAALVVAMTSRPTVELVEHVLGHRAGAALRRAVDAGLVESVRGTLAFTHPLLAAACYSESEPGRRRALHLRLAGLVTDAEERALHLARATRLPNAAVASAIESGADAAYARGAPDAAAVLEEQALSLTPPGDSAALVQRVVRSADLFWEAGQCKRSEGLLLALVDDLPRGADRARVLQRLAIACAALHGWPQSCRLLEEGLCDVGDDEVLHAAFERDLAFAMMQAGDLRPAAPHITAAAEIAGRTALPGPRADAEVLTALARTLRGDDPLSGADRSVLLRSPPPYAGPARSTHRGHASRTVLLAAVLKWSDDFSGARDLLAPLRARLWERQEDGLLMPVLFQLGELECWAGRTAEAEAIAELAQETCERSGLTASEPMWMYLRALTAAYAGRADVALEMAMGSLDVSVRTGEARHQMRALAVAGFVALSLGDAASAVDRLGRVWSLERACGYGHPGVIRAAADEVEALLAVGADRLASERLELLEEASSRSRSRWGRAAALRCRGLLESAAGDLETAVATLRSCVRQHDEVSSPLEHGRALLALGVTLRRANQRSEARRRIAEAIAVLTSCGAVLWVTAAEAELRRLSGPAGATSSPLTAGESAVADCVASGLSNRELARQLSISVKTAEAHLTSIYRKLGLRSRTELVGRVLARDQPS